MSSHSIGKPTARFFVNFHRAAAILWVLLLVSSLLWWKESILWVIFMSLWANVVSHWGAYQAARAEQKGEGESSATAVPPGPCFASAGVVWPNGLDPRCDLRAGHTGAHECSRGSMGGTAVWFDPEVRS